MYVIIYLIKYETTAPGSSRAMISQEKFSKIQGTEASDEGKHVERESESPLNTSKEISKGKFILTLAFHRKRFDLNIIFVLVIVMDTLY